MNDYFGLGFVISVEDNASSAFSNISDALNNLMLNANQSFMNMNVAGMALNQLGNTAENAGKKMIGGLIDVGKNVVSTGATFETLRQTMTALYNSADVGIQKTNWAMQLAAKTPFQMEDLTNMMIRMKSIGVEADKVYDDGAGHIQSLAQYIGDLAALHPEKGLQMTTQEIQELLELSPRGTVAMRSLGVSLETLQKAGAGDKWGATTEERIQQLVKVSGYMAQGLSEKLMTTWQGLTSNIEDQFTRIKLAIADAGVFDAVKATLIDVSNLIGNIDSDQLASLGKSLADAFSMIWKPIDYVVKGISSMVNWVLKITETNPVLAKFVLGLMSIAGALLIGTGLFLKFSGGILMSLASLGMLMTTIVRFGGLTGIFSAIGASITGLIEAILPAVAVAGILFLAWKENFIGIRDMTITFVKNTQIAFGEASRIAHLGSAEMAKAVDQLDRHTFFGELTYRLVQLQVLWESLCDAWNDEALSDENFQKANKLGLLPLISTILDLKRDAEALWKGFEEGLTAFMIVAKGVATVVGLVIGGIARAIVPVVNGILELVGSTARISVKPLEALGYVIGIIAGFFATSKIIGFISSIAGAVGTVFGVVTRIFQFLSPLFSTLMYIGGIVVDVFMTIAETIAIVTGISVGFAAVIVAAVIGAVVLIITYWSQIKQFFSDLWAGIVNETTYLWNSVGEFFSNLWTSIATTATQIWNDIVTDVMNIWNPVANFFSGLFEVLGGIFQIGWSVISGIVQIAWELIKMTVNAGLEFIKFILSPFVSFFTSMWNNMVTNAIALWNQLVQVANYIAIEFMTIWTPVASFFTWLWNEIVNYAISAWGNIVSNWNALVSQLQAIWSPIASFFSTLWSGVVNEATAIWNGLTAFFSALWSAIVNYAVSAWANVVDNWNALVAELQAIWAPIGAFFSSLWNGIVSEAQTLWGQITSVASTVAGEVQGAWNGVASYMNGIWSEVQSAAESLFSWLESKFQWFSDGVANIRSAMSGITSGASEGWDKVKSGVDKMLGFATGAEIYGEGAAVLHPGEVVVNGDLTNRLRTFLNANTQSSMEPQLASSARPIKESSNNSFSSVATSIGSSKSNSDSGNNVPVSNDNSVTISEGAIQITMTNGNEADIRNLVKRVGQEIQRQQHLTSVRNYGLR